jgi:hypothetical protein
VIGARHRIEDVLRPTRPLPRVGSKATLTHFGGERENATVVAVLDGGRHVLVRSDGGEEHEFALSEATAKFVAIGGAGASLRLLD